MGFTKRIGFDVGHLKNKKSIMHVCNLSDMSFNPLRVAVEKTSSN